MPSAVAGDALSWSVVVSRTGRPSGSVTKSDSGTVREPFDGTSIVVPGVRKGNPAPNAGTWMRPIARPPPGSTTSYGTVFGALPAGTVMVRPLTVAVPS